MIKNELTFIMLKIFIKVALKVFKIYNKSIFMKIFK